MRLHLTELKFKSDLRSLKLPSPIQNSSHLTKNQSNLISIESILEMQQRF